jgi:hypothetical protein
MVRSGKGCRGTGVSAGSGRQTQHALLHGCGRRHHLLRRSLVGLTLMAGCRHLYQADHAACKDYWLRRDASIPCTRLDGCLWPQNRPRKIIEVGNARTKGRIFLRIVCAVTVEDTYDVSTKHRGMTVHISCLLRGSFIRTVQMSGRTGLRPLL